MPKKWQPDAWFQLFPVPKSSHDRDCQRRGQYLQGREIWDDCHEYHQIIPVSDDEAVVMRLQGKLHPLGKGEERAIVK